MEDGDYFSKDGYYYDADGYDEKGGYSDNENNEYIYGEQHDQNGEFHNQF